MLLVISQTDHDYSSLIFTGLDSVCISDLNFCANYRPCRNGATCSNSGRGSYTCHCLPGFTGANCETIADDCTHVPCQNGGTCLVDNSLQ